MTELLTIILAAGEGTRMKSARPKVLHEVAGRSILGHVTAAALDAGSDRIAVVTAPEQQAVRDAVSSIAPKAAFFEQAERLGTGHAARMAEPAFRDATGYVAVVYADHPLLLAEHFHLVTDKLDSGNDVAILGFEARDPSGWGRLIVDDEKLLDIREQKDASEEEQKITLCNACILAFRAEIFRALIGKIEANNAQKEYYLTDLVPLANQAGYRVTYALANEDDIVGVNSRQQLAATEALFQTRMRKAAMDAGVTLIDPQSVFFSYDTMLGRDVTIEPNVYFGPGVRVADNATIHAFSHIAGAEIGEGAEIGPFARLRPEAVLENAAKVGNFCEVKKAHIGAGAKINHLSYIGDADVGAGTNVGAGTITCNYDGVNKHRTVIGDNVFVGSNTALVAPVSVGARAYIGSGSVITEDVPEDALALGRGRQVNKPGYAAELRARAQAFKQAKKKEA